MKYCAYCSSVLEDSDKYCQSCGAPAVIVRTQHESSIDIDEFIKSVKEMQEKCERYEKEIEYYQNRCAYLTTFQHKTDKTKADVNTTSNADAAHGCAYIILIAVIIILITLMIL